MRGLAGGQPGCSGSLSICSATHEHRSGDAESSHRAEHWSSGHRRTCCPETHGYIIDNRVRPTPFFKRGGFHAGQSAGFPAAYGQRWSGTAIGGLVGLGVTLAPAMARAQELRIKDAKTTRAFARSARSGVRPSSTPSTARSSTSKAIPAARTTRAPSAQGRGDLPAPPQPQPGDQGAAPQARREGLEVVELEWAMDRVAELIKKTATRRSSRSSRTGSS